MPAYDLVYRLRDLRVDPAALVRLLCPGGTPPVRVPALPADAEVVGCYWRCWPRDTLVLRVRSAESPVVPDGEEPPVGDLPLTPPTDLP